jgi:GT2 family glycosyltransferase
MNKIVSVIIVSYNTASLTLKCVKHVLDSVGLAKTQLEIIVVDNNSSDNTAQLLSSSYPDIKVISSKKNLGFGGGNNLGVSNAKGDYILLLNTDAFLQPDSLSRLLDFLQNNQNLLAVAPMLAYDDGKLQQSLGYFPTPLRVVGWMWGLDKLPLTKTLFPTPYHQYDLSKYKSDLSPDWLMGACVLLRKSAYQSVSGFDETIFMYGEEVELFYRLKKKYPNQMLRLLTTVVVTHLGSYSSDAANTSRLLSELDGIITFYNLHFPKLTWAIKIVISIGVILRIILFSLIPSRQRIVRQYLAYLGQAKHGRVQ